MTDKHRVMSFTCDTHGEIWSAAVYCQHDIDHEMRLVSDAHRAPFGACCHRRMTVELLDAETMELESMRRDYYDPGVTT